ncbi:lipase 3-like [Choristoneura fumiferana]|uniref:lipase 3-like n=1 Tax=Choristoneura fumiferana TaxID=7141 RepID=UPI003D159DC2
MAPQEITCLLFIVSLSICSAATNTVALLANLTSIPISKEANKGTGFVELATKYGYNTESHVVTTEDGYVLILHRIPPATHCAKKTPLYLLHNIHQSSTGFLSIAEQSPGFIFSDDCYDVWFGNLRGNEYGRKHVSLDPDKDLEFWKFHIHENGVYDVPASIDYILDNTGSEQLIYIGFSHGGGAFFVLNSEKPEYASKISLHVSLAPSTRLLNNKSLAIRTLTVTINELRLALEAAGVWELVAKGFPLQGFLATLCQIPLLAAVVCGLATAVVDAPHPGSLPPEAQKRIYSTLLSGTSVETFAHYGQLETSKKFSKFDYGLVENLKRYGSATPPEYDFKASNVPVVMFQGLNDHITDVADTDWVVEQLPNVIDYIKLEDPLWNHLDMLYSVYWKDKIYARMKTYLQQYSKVY